MIYNSVIIRGACVEMRSTTDIESAEELEHRMYSIGMKAISFGDINGDSGYTIVYFDPNAEKMVKCDNRHCSRYKLGSCTIPSGFIHLTVPDSCKVYNPKKDEK